MKYEINNKTILVTQATRLSIYEVNANELPIWVWNNGEFEELKTLEEFEAFNNLDSVFFKDNPYTREDLYKLHIDFYGLKPVNSKLSDKVRLRSCLPSGGQVIDINDEYGILAIQITYHSFLPNNYDLVWFYEVIANSDCSLYEPFGDSSCQISVNFAKHKRAIKLSKLKRYKKLFKGLK